MKQTRQYFDAARLIGKFLHGELTPEETAVLKTWVEEDEAHRALWEHLTDPAYLEENLQYWEDRKDKARYWKLLAGEIGGKRTGSRRVAMRKLLRYAAVVIPVVLIAGGWLYVVRHRAAGDVTGSAATLAGVHIMPRGKVAQLVLANGKIVKLNDTLREAITEKDGTTVRNRASALSYLSGAAHTGGAILYNTLMTPRGGEYRLKLADGTKVWLNAASSLRYPTRFNGKERTVYLSGEAYFEVAKDERHPFIVEAGNTDITVLGTKFNVSAYPDDPKQKTTLAEGLVQVDAMQAFSSGKGILLKPGYEALVNEGEEKIRIRKANVEAALAWKNGLFIFDGESLGSLMRKLSRWYDVDVAYDAGVDTLFHFTGRIQRYENITGILHLIELTGKVKFVVKGNKIEISSK